jgi:hypothetical protein
MKRLLEFLLTGCFHKWEIECRSSVYPPELYGFHWEGKPKSLPIGHKFTSRCKKCGEIKTHHDY